MDVFDFLNAKLQKKGECSKLFIRGLVSLPCVLAVFRVSIRESNCVKTQIWKPQCAGQPLPFYFTPGNLFYERLNFATNPMKLSW